MRRRRANRLDRTVCSRRCTITSEWRCPPSPASHNGLRGPQGKGRALRQQRPQAAATSGRRARKGTWELRGSPQGWGWPLWNAKKKEKTTYPSKKTLGRDPTESPRYKLWSIKQQGYHSSCKYHLVFGLPLPRSCSALVGQNQGKEEC